MQHLLQNERSSIVLHVMIDSPAGFQSKVISLPSGWREARADSCAKMAFYEDGLQRGHTILSPVSLLTVDAKGTLRLYEVQSGEVPLLPSTSLPWPTTVSANYLGT